jgi:uncharacterized SAM-binding protein YcdF (DUF218 family)
MLVVALAGFLLLLVYAIYRIAAQGAIDDARRADAIVVLGAAQFNGQPSDVFEARLQHAVDLWNEGLAPYLIVTGGKLPADITTEAATARAWAVAKGVPNDAILDEDRGRNTLESLDNVAALLRAHHFDRVLFVSDRTHMLRVLRMAKDLGIVGYGSPTPTSPTDLDADRRWKSIAHELAGLAAYFVGGGRLLEDPATANLPS